MRIGFLDDSVQYERIPRLGMGEVVAVGTVMVPDVSLRPYATKPSDEEIKWMPSKESHLATLPGDAVHVLRRKMLEADIERGLASAVVIWDRGRLPWNRKDVAPEILEYLYERAEMHLSDDRDLGLRRQARWWPCGRREMARAVDASDGGRNPACSPEKVVLPIITADSSHLPHLQLADLIVAATTAAVAGRPAGVVLALLLNAIAHENALGTAGGAGIVLWPPELYNLHHWGFGEDGYWKVARGAGVTVPYGQWPYHIDNGLKDASST